MKVVSERTFMDVYDDSERGNASPASPNRRNSMPWNGCRSLNEGGPASFNIGYRNQLLAQAYQLRNEALGKCSENSFSGSTITGPRASSQFAAGSRQQSLGLGTAMLTDTTPGTCGQACPSQADLGVDIGEYALYSSMESPAYVHPHSDFHKPHMLMYSQSPVNREYGMAKNVSVGLPIKNNLCDLDPDKAVGDDGNTFVTHDMPRNMSFENIKDLLGAWGLLQARDFGYMPSRNFQKTGNKRVASPAASNRRNSVPWGRSRSLNAGEPTNVDNVSWNQLLAQANLLRNEAPGKCSENALTDSTITGSRASSQSTTESPRGSFALGTAMLTDTKQRTAAQACPLQADLKDHIGEHAIYSAMKSPIYVHPHKDFYKPPKFMYHQSSAIDGVDQESTMKTPALQSSAAVGDEGETFMIHDMPRSMSLEKMRELIESWGLLHACDFCFIPYHHLQKGNKRAAVGYGHVHFKCKQAGAAFYEALHGKRLPGSQTKHSISVRRRTFESLGEAILKRRLAPHDYWASDEMRCLLNF